MQKAAALENQNRFMDFAFRLKLGCFGFSHEKSGGLRKTIIKDYDKWRLTARGEMEFLKKRTLTGLMVVFIIFRAVKVPWIVFIGKSMR